MNGGRRRPRARALSTWISVVALLALVTALGRPAATLAFILLKDMSDQAGSLSAALNFNASALEGCRNIRWDADYSRNPHPGMPPVYVPVCADLSPAELRSLHQFRERQTSTPFSIVFTCTDVTEAICQKAKLGFEKAGKRIAQALKIDTTIVVQATFKSFCEGQGASCALRNTLGQAQASSYLQGKIGDDGPWLFPQALFKQINSGAQVQLKEVDIIAEFNTDFKFWFEGDGSISSEQVDFELVVAHEYAHGLGWTSSFNTWFSSVFGVVQSQDFLTPNMLIQSPVGSNSISSATFAGWQQLQIFDKYIYATETGKSWVDSAKVITSFTGPSRTTLANWVPLFQQSGAPYQEAQTCYKTATSGYRKLEFRIPSTAASKGGSSVYLQTLDQWLPGSSIAHADLQSYVTGPDFLMIPDVTGLTGRTLDTILAAQSPGWKYGPIGPLTAGMLSAMGWPTLIAAQDGNVTVNGTTDGATTPNTPSGTPTTPTKIGPFTIPQFVGIVVGALAVAGLLVAGAIFFSRRRKNGKAPSASGASSSPGYILNAYPSHPSVPPPVYRHEAPPNVLPNGAAVFYGYPSSAPQNPYLNGAYGAAAASSPQERADAELARTLQEQEEAFAGIPLAAVANRGTRPPPIAGPSPVSRAPPPAPPALPPRRMDDMAIEGDLSDYELAKRLQEEEERAAGISAAVAYGAQPRASPRPSFAAPLPPPPGGAAIETPTLGSIQDRIRALQSGSARPPGSYLND